MKFKVGDRVRCINNGVWGENLLGKYGTIKAKYGDSSCGVEFDKYICGHSCSGNTKYGHGWYCEETMLELADEKTKPILIYRDGLKVTAEDKNTGRTGVAKCNPSDEFDFYTGAKLALERLTGEGKKYVDFSDMDFSECVPKIKVGDYVRVTDLGASYSLFDSFFKAYEDIPVDVAARYIWGIEPKKDKPYKVLCIKKHPIFGNDVCVIEKSSGEVYIVGIEGIEKC